jgi:hypothetical protein
MLYPTPSLTPCRLQTFTRPQQLWFPVLPTHKLSLAYIAPVEPSQYSAVFPSCLLVSPHTTHYVMSERASEAPAVPEGQSRRVPAAVAPTSNPHTAPQTVPTPSSSLGPSDTTAEAAIMRQFHQNLNVQIIKVRELKSQGQLAKAKELEDLIKDRTRLMQERVRQYGNAHVPQKCCAFLF